MQAGRIRIEPCDADSGITAVDKQGIQQGEDGIDRVRWRTPHTACKAPVLGKGQGQMLKIEGRSPSFQTAQAVHIGGILDLAGKLP